MVTAQHPINSGFSAASTSVDVIAGINLVGKVAIVTGGYAGLGLETARTLALAGARVIVPARDVERAQRTVAEAGGGIEIRPMDLTDPQSIDRFAAHFVQSGLPLHILVNSAGIMAVPTRELDGRGNELQFSTNHLGHFQLTARLWPALVRGGQATGGARVVSVSSLGHRFSPVVFEDINFERRDYEPWSAYGQSKTANILFAVELDRLAQTHGVRAFSLHPGGIVGTGLAKHMTEDMLRKAGAIDENGAPVVDLSRDLKSVPQGAATQIWCAVSPQLEGKGGVFCLDSDIAAVLPEGARGTQPGAGPRLAGVEAYAIDVDAAKRLWTVSEETTGVTFPL
ncbi:SDR family NAD(P)-dependent oxidoreductase [Rhizobiales bacterium RZME27]|uniref:Probable oxidoreductase n=1 Tax=Endobacterium cereale TaxID=2663029 RepID=A0A6A8AJS4_9HYPH|nr:SDR family NAD(P)-dependent oxidoreductase [Endobacterium cereale]MEB2845694.1 SDR family NAD(P)-dependent oxidoreductase [Endobacterium cereale]MQY50148.1 SDR family NAD(P)-dependent oxidoreductase [Endobacterium cereale]